MAEQLELPVNDPVRPPAEPAGAAACPPQPCAVDLAARLPRGVHLGTSSWSFPGWQGLVYAHGVDRRVLARDGLRAYARHPLFNCVGIDRSFYAPLTVRDYAGYAGQVGAEFRFLIKAPALCTAPYSPPGSRDGGSNPHYLDGHFARAHFVRPCLEGLGHCAGPLLFQFPPQGAAVLAQPWRFAERLHAFLTGLPAGPVYAVELRDRGLLGGDYRRALVESGAQHCFSVHPRMPSPLEQRRQLAGLGPGPLVLRWNLRQGLGYQAARKRYQPFNRLIDPDPGLRRQVAGIVADAAAAGERAYVIANNKAEGCAPLTLLELARCIGDSGRGGSL